MRIAQCNDTFLPIVDGVGRVTFEYAQSLARRSHECYVVVPMRDAGYRGNYPFEIVDFASVKVPGSPQYSTGIAKLDNHYVTRMDMVELDIVHAHSPGPSGLEAARLAAKHKIPLIGTFHSKYQDDILRYTRSEGIAQIGAKYVADFFDRCDEVWTVSYLASQTLRSYGYAGRIEIVPHGTNIPVITEADKAAVKEAYALNGDPVLLYVGQMDRKKNIRLTLEAAAALHRSGKRFLLVLAGQGKDFDAIRALADELGLHDAVRFTGHIADARTLNGLYASASLFVFPSAYDTAGLVVREAAAAGTPSVVLMDSAPAEVIQDGKNGFLCENDRESLAAVLDLALSDMHRLKAVGERAKETIPIPWEKVMDGVEERYRALCEKRRPVLKRKRGPLRRGLTVVDQSLEKRTVDMLWRFARQDFQHVYTYPYTPQKRISGRGPVSALPRSTPEDQGMNSRDILTLYHSLDSSLASNLHAMMVVKNGHVISEGYWAPYGKEYPHQLYSLSKSITGIAIGMLVDEGKLSLSERLVDIFADKVADPSAHHYKDATVWNLLTMSTGSRFNEVGSALGPDWEQEFLDAGTRFPVGTQFCYNSMNSYMLAAIVRRKAKMGLLEYLEPRLFEPLGIRDVSWDTCPMGTEKGGWGLTLRLEDVAKIGLLYLQNGKYTVNGEERRLLSEDWVKESTRVQIETPNGECKDGYGYQIWCAPHPGGYLFNGAFGQYMLALPQQDALVVLFGGSPLLFAQTDTMEYVYRCFPNANHAPLPKNPAAQRALSSFLSELSCRNKEDASPNGCMPMPFNWVREQLSGNTYSFDANKTGIFPFVLQSVHNIFPAGISSVSFRAAEDGGMALSIKEGDATHTLEIREDAFTHATLQIGEEQHPVGISARFGMLSNGEAQLRLYLYYLTTPCTRIVTFVLKEDTLHVTLDENPTVQKASAMLMTLVQLAYSEFGSMLRLLRRDRVQSHLFSFGTSTVAGRRAAEPAGLKEYLDA
ncbi:MAG TPA: glycosyltransferase [Feifaniaceae bacterium]|nr:glycosyltransferase [Feifaniaceae bacterium]